MSTGVSAPDAKLRVRSAGAECPDDFRIRAMKEYYFGFGDGVFPIFL